MAKHNATCYLAKGISWAGRIALAALIALSLFSLGLVVHAAWAGWPVLLREGAKALLIVVIAIAIIAAWVWAEEYKRKC